MADMLVIGGWRDAGYEYLMMDDCWLSKNRTLEGKLQADPDRFPSGIKALAEYCHKLGLKFGIYEDYGTETCAGYPGSLGHFDIDAQTFAEWGVDYVKFDGCHSDPATMDVGFPQFGEALARTGLALQEMNALGILNFFYQAVPWSTNVSGLCIKDIMVSDPTTLPLDNTATCGGTTMMFRTIGTVFKI